MNSFKPLFQAKFALLFAIVVAGISCSGEETKLDNEVQTKDKKAEQLAAAQKERDETFGKIQKYVDIKYPAWTVKGVTKYETEYTVEGEKIFYYVLMANSEKTKMVFLIRADFVLIDGKVESHIFEPTQITLDRRKNEIMRGRNKEEALEEMNDRQREQYYKDNVETNY